MPIQTRTCPECDIMFEVPHWIKKVCCSPTCAANYQWKDPAKAPLPRAEVFTSTCIQCGDSFEHTRTYHNDNQPRFCGKECSFNFHNIPADCKVCGTRFTRRRSQPYPPSFCSRKCSMSKKGSAIRNKAFVASRKRNKRIPSPTITPHG